MSEHDEHYIVPFKVYIFVILALLFFTILTVTVSNVSFGSTFMNFLVAMVIAGIKSSLVLLFFMGLRWDSWLNRTCVFGTFLALFAFIFLTASDVWYREEEGFIPVKEVSSTLSMEEIKGFEASSSALIEKGKLSFNTNCASCHGSTGKGDGLAAAALAKKPRNFSDSAASWVNGTSPKTIFMSITEGIKGSPMAAYLTLPVEDRWALVHYILTLVKDPKGTGKRDVAYDEFLKKLTAGGSSKKVIPIGLAKELMLKKKKK